MAGRLVSCSNCSATFMVPEGVSAVVCPFCRYQIVLTEETVLDFPVYMLPVRVSKGEAVEILVEEMSKQVGVSERALEDVKKAKVVLFLLPFMVFDSDSYGVIKYKKWRGDVAFKGEVAVPLHPNFSFLTGISIPPAARCPIDANLAQTAIFVPADFNVKAIRPEVEVVEGKTWLGVKVIKAIRIDRGEGYDPKREAEEYVKNRIIDLSLARGQRPVDFTIKLEPVMVVYVPFYLMEYGPSRDKGYLAIMNASNGEVIIAMYEEGGEFRAKALGRAVFAVLAGAVSWFVSNSLLPLVAGFVVAAPFLYRSLVRVHSFGTKSGLFNIGQAYVIKKSLEEIRKGEQ